MADMDKLNKINDDDLEGVAGGVMIDKGFLDKTPVNKNEKAGVVTAEKDDNMDGEIKLLSGQTKSGGKAGLGSILSRKPVQRA